MADRNPFRHGTDEYNQWDAVHVQQAQNPLYLGNGDDDDDDDVIIVTPQQQQQPKSMQSRLFRRGNMLYLMVKDLPLGEITCRSCTYTISVENMNSLAGNNWLDDTIINAFTESRPRGNNSVTSVNTRIYTSWTLDGRLTEVLKNYLGNRQSSKEWHNCFGFSQFIMPINNEIPSAKIKGTHWLLAVIDFEKGEIVFYDSLREADKEYTRYYGPIIEKLLFYKGQLDDAATKPNDRITPEMTDRAAKVGKLKMRVERDYKQQDDGCSCGVFVCKQVELLLQGNREFLHKSKEFNVGAYREYIRKTLLDNLIPE